MNSLDKIKELPDKKRYFEFVTAALSVPVLITVLLTNINNLKTKPQTTQAVPTQAANEIIKVITVTPATLREKLPPPSTPSASASATPTTTPDAACKKEVGPVEISSPAEGATLAGNPVNVDISDRPDGYCAVVWSYRINGSTWSEYTDKSISLYNLPPGPKLLELKVKSVVSGGETLLKRTFTVEGVATLTPTSTPEATSSAVSQ